ADIDEVILVGGSTRIPTIQKMVEEFGSSPADLIAGIGYGGALGAKKFGAMGSLVGMGVGAVLGATASNKIQDIIA
ncbi:MAG: Hsp70 family protein, partial [bacterium]